MTSELNFPSAHFQSSALKTGGLGSTGASGVGEISIDSPKVSITHVAEEVGSATAQSARKLEESRADLEKAIEELRAASKNLGRELGFRVDASTNRSIVTVSDASSGKVIRQIPEEVVIRVANSIEQLKGLLFDESL